MSESRFKTRQIVLSYIVLTALCALAAIGVYVNEGYALLQLLWGLITLTLSSVSFSILTRYRGTLESSLDVSAARFWMVCCVACSLFIVIFSLSFPQSPPGLVTGASGPILGLSTASCFIPFISQSRPEYIAPDDDVPASEIAERISKKEGARFVSITSIILDPSFESVYACPECGLTIDFREPYEWQGPTAFACPYCEQVVHMHQLDI